MTDIQMPPHVVLASGSPYRAQLLARLGLEFESQASEIDETPIPGESGHDLALRLARAKALAVAALRPDAVIIGSDQVAECRGRLMGKPGRRAAAIEQLAFCSGREVIFHTALALTHGECTRVSVSPTRVQMRALDRMRIERYVDAEQPFDCAGAMKSEALGISLCEGISSDDPTALIGLPLTRVVSLLSEFGIDIP